MSPKTKSEAFKTAPPLQGSNEEAGETQADKDTRSSASQARSECVGVLSDAIRAVCKRWGEELARYASDPSQGPPEFMPKTADGLREMVDLLNELAPVSEAGAIGDAEATLKPKVPSDPERTESIKAILLERAHARKAFE